ncbi:L-galactose-1-phosphate phosphatase [Tribonema minus]|uniref:Inositol-1-monophosphatase n=1 Tax=Tribonema minus TaxID=303371 RepID=A0A835YX17_9STRA|nr:L-galactose-1-phosphate phosphatase [Tribonema minus]
MIQRSFLLLVASALSSAHAFIPPQVSHHSAHVRLAPAATAAVAGADPTTIERILATATRAAKKAGELMIREAGAEIIKTKTNPKDLLTKVDGMCQDAIKAEVDAEFEGEQHAFLGEENVAPGPEASIAALKEAVDSSDYLWIVDPIDGTTNFCHAMPLSAVSIGVAYRGTLVAGCVYDPYADELFTATAGGGAFLNGKKVVVGPQASLCATLGEALVAGGAPPGLLALGPCMRGMVAMSPHVRSFRMLGSAAIMLAWVACGRLTAYFEPDLNAWDVAAGALLIQEAGGLMTHCNGTPYSLTTRSILGSNGRAHKEMVDILVAAEAAELDTEPRIG